MKEKQKDTAHLWQLQVYATMQYAHWWPVMAVWGCETKCKNRVWMIYVSHHAASGGQVSFVNLQTLGMLLYMLPSANSS